MELEIQELKEQISVLTEKVEILEKKENRRKAFTYAKILIKVILIIVTIFSIYQGYQYLVKELSNIMEEKIKELNPLNKYM